jgi:hypothetical protein
MPRERSDALVAAAGASAAVERQSGDEIDLLGPAWKFLSPVLLP